MSGVALDGAVMRTSERQWSSRRLRTCGAYKTGYNAPSTPPRRAGVVCSSCESSLRVCCANATSIACRRCCPCSRRSSAKWCASVPFEHPAHFSVACSVGEAAYSLRVCTRNILMEMWSAGWTAAHSDRRARRTQPLQSQGLHSPLLLSRFYKVTHAILPVHALSFTAHRVTAEHTTPASWHHLCDVLCFAALIPASARVQRAVRENGTR
jgi:hypothetical protein